MDETTSIWSTRGGQRPRDIPICGFTGKTCPPTNMSYNVIVIPVGVTILLSFIAIVSASIWTIW